jgi:two-component system sensor histidine kinase UhpB
MPRQGGGIIWQRWVNHPIFGPAGELEEFQCIGQDITDRKRAEELAELLTHAQHEERKRIARDLHDDFNQRVAAHAIALSNLRKYIVETRRKSGPLLQRVDKLQKEAVALGEEIRVIAHQLHPPSIERDGLEGALRALCNDFGALGHLRVNLKFDGSTTGLPAKVTLCCFRLVQEGLCNVAKHAHASEVTVKVTAVPDRVSLEVADNGIGLNGNGTHHEGGLGISSMRERVKLLSGTFRIGKRSPSGTLMTAVLPVTTHGG